MNKKTFQEYFKQKGFKVYEHTAFGVENGYPITAKYVQNRLWNILLSVDMAEPKVAIKELKREYGKKGRLSYGKGVLYVSITVGNKEYDDNYKAAVAELLTLLQKKGHKPVKACPMCKSADCDVIAAVPNYTATHRRCLDKMMADIHNKAEKNEVNGNYLTGIIGAFLGAIVGILPSLLIVILGDTIYAVLFALIPLCIYQGYKLLGGKMNYVVIVLTIIFSVISVYFMQILLLVYWSVVEEGVILSYVLATMSGWLVDKQLWIVITQKSIINFVFIALGIYIAWTKISKTTATEIKNATDVYETAIPWNGGMSLDTFHRSNALDHQEK